MPSTVVSSSGLTSVLSSEGWSRQRRVLFILATVCFVMSIVTGVVITIQYSGSWQPHPQQTTDVERTTTSTSSTTSSTETSTTTDAAEYYLSYGTMTGIHLTSFGMQINSRLLFNALDGCQRSGFVTNITVNFFRPFNPDATLDGFLWFAIIGQLGQITSRYSVRPLTGANAPSIQSFAVPQRALIAYTKDNVAVGSFANKNDDKINQLYGLNGGAVVYAPMPNETENLGRNSWSGISGTSIALSYVVLHNIETSSLDSQLSGGGPDLG